MKYVAGFLFTADLQQVVLIWKNKPQWQAGKVNAVGGKVEGDESPTVAQMREFEEETGVLFEDWRVFLKMQLPESKENDIVYFAVGASDLAKRVGSPTDEKVCLIEVDSIKHGVPCFGYEMPPLTAGKHVMVEQALAAPVYNLPWLVQMALDSLKNRNTYEVLEKSKWW
jgi:8-oxo-dGTP pyrophosphatase MutT (NUDIX family)